MTISASDLRDQIQEQAASHFEAIFPEAGYPTHLVTRRMSLADGVEVVLQEVTALGSDSQTPEEYFLTIIDNRVRPPRVHAFRDDSPLGALACESLDSAVATEPDARSSAEWYKVDSPIGQSIASYVLFTLDPRLHPAATAIV